MTMKIRGLVACPECDALQREVDLPPGAAADCVRCGAELYRCKPASLDRTLACLIAAAIAFAFANTAPLMELDAQGIRTSTTLFGVVRALVETGWPSVAALFFATVILVPAIALATGLYVLGALKLRIVPPGLAPGVRLIGAAWPWAMVEVFLLGALVSLVKLKDLARIDPEWGLYSVGAYVLLSVAAVAAFEPREMWRRAEALRP
jgi:paraquat-inducible protein A